MNAFSIGIIGGADGPTAVFVTSPGWLNWSGLIILAALLIPNLIYALRRPGQGIQSRSRVLNLMEQVSRYGCILLMAAGFRFWHIGSFTPVSIMVGAIGVPVLIILYWLCWIPWFRRKRKWNAAALAILPGLVFFLCGFTFRNWILMPVAAVFTICRTIISVQAPLD